MNMNRSFLLKGFLTVLIIYAALSFSVSKALIIYVSQFDDPSISPLEYSKNDAEAFAEFLKTYEIVPQENIEILPNPTLGWMKAKVRDFFSKANEGDTLIFYYSGHGYYDSKAKKTYFIPKDTMADYVFDTAFPVEDYLEPLVKSSKAKVYMFIDACYSGRLGKDRPLRFKHFSKTTFERVVENSKVAMLLSSGPDEVSKEDEKLKHGVFTYYLIEGLRGKANENNDPYVTLDELYDYVKSEVSKKTGGLQNPQMITVASLKSDVISFDFSLIETKAFEMVKNSNIDEVVKKAVGKIVAQSPYIDSLDEKFIREYIWKLGLGKLEIKDFERIVKPKAAAVARDIKVATSQGISIPGMIDYILTRPLSVGVGVEYNFVEDTYLKVLPFGRIVYSSFFMEFIPWNWIIGFDMKIFPFMNYRFGIFIPGNFWVEYGWNSYGAGMFFDYYITLFSFISIDARIAPIVTPTLLNLYLENPNNITSFGIPTQFMMMASVYFTFSK